MKYYFTGTKEDLLKNGFIEDHKDCFIRENEIKEARIVIFLNGVLFEKNEITFDLSPYLRKGLSPLKSYIQDLIDVGLVAEK